MTEPAKRDYWDHKGRLQGPLMRLHAELVPIQGAAKTHEGEMLRAANSLHYQCFNNGFGNNVSGAYLYLKKHLPGFKKGWSESLSPRVTGAGDYIPDAQTYAVVEDILDATVSHVLSKEGKYSAPKCDHRDLTVRETGDESRYEFDAETDEEDVLRL